MASNQNVTQLTQQTGSANTTSLFYAVTSGVNDTGLPLSVLVNSLGLTGTPTTPTATTGTNTTQIASTAFVQAQLTSSLGSYAPLASPTFTGTVVIPTVTISAGSINSTQIGNSTPSTGAFTTLSSSGLANLSSLSTASAAITGGTINSTSVGATTPSTGAFTTLSTTGLYSPSTTVGIKGTTAADSAQAGSIGEFITSNATGVALTTSTTANVTSISLTAGDWDVWGNVWYVPAGTTTLSVVMGGVNTTSATFQGGTTGNTTQNQCNSAAGQNASAIAPMQRINVSATTTVYLLANAAFSVSTCTASGTINARRRR
jgi:hypothetical protein